MKILVLNCGSSSIKYKLFEMESKQVIAQGGVEKIGLPDSFLMVKLTNGEKVQITQPMPEHTVGIELILKTLTDPQIGCISSLQEINAVGHRVVHGGERFNQSVIITDEVRANIEACAELAPLHNPANLKGIDAITKTLPGVPQVAVFDTAFHQTMPDYAYMYALPYELYQKYAIRRYGFHGTSHRYVSKRVCDFLGVDATAQKIITAHIGNGGSCAAVLNGKSVDTSMGLTPVEGLMMGTRAGDLDLGAAVYIMDKEGLNTAEFSTLVNKKSGLAGVSGVSSDARDIDAAVQAGNERANLARKMFIYRVIKYIGAYAAAMNGVDTIVFTGGIGENDAYIRGEIIKGLSYLGITLDETTNNATRGKEAVLSTPDSKVTVCIIPTDEELMIATDTAALVG
ncbi:MAG: acetate kinase [Paludibacter sp.]|nr:acetate kinase [Bacteroidales bacterium]MCM1069235.1 acetate kinase [Prevotella sp.]MCM1354345.1 acetate kinase [Bacteroides sp.]MCM1443195.1 acetate kinase [Muribaculum sp.]MCM1481790.1 acetate kinase [Paludibacter sp.]